MTLKDLKIWWTLIYVASIVIVNYAFSVLPILPLGEGIVIPSATFLVGLIFVFRDFAQREVGHYVILAMLLAGALSYVLADPTIAIASVTAFLVSEFADWGVYSFTGRPFPQRVLLSSVLATPIDSALFLYMIGFFSIQGVIIMTLVKMVGALAVWWMIRKRMS
ncbi:hypothetical protein LCGC14_0669230 [marine sediment metagenome]|uniref:PreQ0 transporter n=1 Tax=marine sediment metagenome TaxID=412755 RepID=A0A0F9QRE8_9ZZZZ